MRALWIAQLGCVPAGKGNRTVILLALSLTIHLRLSSRNQSRCHKSGCESVSNMGSVQILKIEDYANADIKISFESRDRGDGSPFDARGGPDSGWNLSSCFSTTRWEVSLWFWRAMGAFDCRLFALHEIGHLLGLAHSSVEGAIMFPSISAGLPNVGYKVQLSLVFIYIGPQAWQWEFTYMM